jgi:hypothetical protein
MNLYLTKSLQDNYTNRKSKLPKNYHLIRKRKSNKTESKGVKCQKCSTETTTDELYILDVRSQQYQGSFLTFQECTHRFCKSCIKDYVADRIQTSVAVECPLKDCKIVLSVRDMKDLLPQIQKQHSFLNPTKGSSKATERIMAELKHIMKSDPEKNVSSKLLHFSNNYIFRAIRN